MAHVASVTPDGWVVTDLRAFHLLVGHVPPRPWGLWDQIRSDLSEPKITWAWTRGLLFTAAGACLVAIVIVTDMWPLLLVAALALYRGLRLFWAWSHLAHYAIHSIRSHPIATGVVSEFNPHPIVPTLIQVGQATRASGEPVDVGAEAPLAQAIQRAGIPAEVWFLDSPGWQYRTVFAGRPQTPNTHRFRT